MPKSYSNLTFTESAHIGLNDDTPEVPLKIKRNVDIALDDNIRGVTIDYNVSGTTAQSGDHFYEALHIDLDSSATGGDTSQETRLVGIKCNVTDIGDSNDIYGGYFDARAGKSVANDIISQVNGVYALVKATHTAGEVKNLYGVNALVQTDNASSGTDLTSIRGVQGVVQQTGDSGKVVANAYGGHFKVDLAASSNDGTFTNCDGVYGEIEIDDADITVSSARAVKGVIDSNGGTITSAYQFFGTTSTSGTITNSWGIYLQNCAKNYIQGTLRLPSYGAGTLVTDSDGNITAGSALSSFLPLSGGTLTGDLNGDIITLTQGAYSDGYRLVRSGHDTYRIALGDSEGLQIINETDSSRKELRFDGDGNVTISGTVTANGTTLTGNLGNVTTSNGSIGGVAFFDSSTNLTTTNKLFFDDTNKRLSINGGTTPSNTLQLGGNGLICTSSSAEINLEANGDILMGASSTFQVDGDAGTTGKYLESTGSGLQWSTPSTSQTILISNFDDATNTTSYQNIPFNYIFESATQSYYHVFACPAAGTVKRITFMHVHGSMTIGQGSTTTQLQVVKNGSIADTSGELSGDNGSADGSKIVYEPGTSFANGDRLQFQFSRSQANLYWRGVAVSIVLEFTHV
jgi:hypothetical protein